MAGDSIVPNTNISFSVLRNKWATATFPGGSDPGNKDNVSLSEFRGATFTDSTSVPASGEISINDDFKGKTFGSSFIDISSNFYEISRRFIVDLPPPTSDYTGNYDVEQVQFSFSGSTGRIYIGIKTTASLSWYNDIAVAAVQLLSSSGTVKNTWVFHDTSGGTGSGWKTYTSQTSAQSSTGFPVTPQTASGYTYSDISTSNGTGKFSFATSTGSSHTGVDGGINSSATSFTVGDGTVSQVGSNYYAFRETSNSTRYTGAIMRSPAVYISDGDIIKVVHLVVGHSTSQMDPTDCLYVGVYEDSGGGGPV